jgi:uncharacterized SAM-binding protein YcdF (DUF218 family)
MNMKHRKSGNILRKILQLTLIGILLWLVVLGVQISSFGRQSSSQPADTAIVLGAAVYREWPSPVFRERINHAIRLYEEGQVGAIIFTGGTGFNDNISEAEAARQYALSAGVPDEAIYMETSSTNTYGNLQNAKAVMEVQGFRTALVVSDPLHMRRAMSYAADLGLDAESSPTTTTRYVSLRPRLNFLLREVYFMALYQILPGQV